MSAFSLLRERRFSPFFWTQFLGAANDNIFKFVFTLLITYKASEYTSWNSSFLIMLIPAIFIAPFVLFSATSGQLADKYDRTRIMQFVKLFEIGILILASIGFYWKSAGVLLACTFFLGLHSTLFGPAKYAYLPSHLKPSELIAGNGLVEMGTFIAILLGTIFGGIIALWDVHYVVSITMILSIIGYVVSRRIPLTNNQNPNLVFNWNPVTETIRNLAIARENRSVFLSLLGISWLWFFGAIFLSLFAPFAKDVLHADSHVVTLLLTTFSIGIALGSILCEKMSGSQVEIGLVPFGSIGMSIFGIDLYFACMSISPISSTYHIQTFISEWSHIRIMLDLFLMALFSGFYSVPLYALIQSRAQEQYRARIIAANNILNAGFMIVASLFSMLILNILHFSIPTLFLMVALLNVIVATYIYTLVPEFLIRFLAWLLIHSVYKLKKVNTDAIPQTGAAVLICNHVSFVDAVVLMGSSPRPIRFVMDHKIFKVPVLSFIFRTAKAIPIASAKVDANMLAQAYDDVSAALQEGELVCIFPEGRITDTGEMYPFKSGVSKIVERDPVPVIPMALKGLWGSYFSRKGGSAFSMKNVGFASPITLIVGFPTMETNPEVLQQQVQVLLNSEI